MNRHGAVRKLDASTDSLSRASPVCARRPGARQVATLAAWVVLATGVSPLAADNAAGGVANSAVDTAVGSAADNESAFKSYTDEELSQVAADWQSLTSEERRDYFIEVRRRMAEAGKRPVDPAGMPQVVGERRFGRIIPQPDGSVLRIEGVVRYRGRGVGEDGVGENGVGGVGESGVGESGVAGNVANDASETETPPDYGTGFVQRVEQSGEAAGDPAVQPPVRAPVVPVAAGKGVRQTEVVVEEDVEEDAEDDEPETTTTDHGAEDKGRAQGHD